MSIEIIAGKYNKWKEGHDDGYIYDEIFEFVDGELSRGELCSLLDAAPEMAAELQRLRAKCERMQDELNKTEEALAVSRMEQSELNYARAAYEQLTIDKARLLEVCIAFVNARGYENRLQRARERAYIVIAEVEGES